MAYRRASADRLRDWLLVAEAGDSDSRKDRDRARVLTRSVGVNLVDQTSIIAAALIVGFIVYITIKGELPKYLAIIGV